MRERLEIPWATLRATDPYAFQGMLSDLGGSWGCVFTLQTSDGFARWDGSRFTILGAYVEEPPPPETQRVAALSVTGDSATIAVAFHGMTEHYSKLIDVYRTSNGRYLYSLVATNGMVWLVRRDGIYYSIGTKGGYPIVRAASPKLKNPPEH